MRQFVLRSMLIFWVASGFAWSQEAATPPPPPAEYELVFAEDFSDPSSIDRFVFASPSHWERVQVGDRWALEHSHAGAAGYSPPHRSPHNIALIATHRFKNFVLDCELQQTGRAYGHRDACLFFSFVDPAHFYYTHIATKADPHAHQIFLVNDAPRTSITQKGSDGFDWKATDQWHPVRLIRDADSGKIDVFIDDFRQPILQTVDRTHEWGFVGLGSFDDTGRVTNIRVYAPQAKEEQIPFFGKKRP